MGLRRDLALAGPTQAVAAALTQAWAGARNAANRFAPNPENLTYARTGLGYAVIKPAPDSFAGKRVCLFAHYDRDEVIDPHVAHYLRALRSEGFELVLLSAGAKLAPESVEIARGLCCAIVLRENHGLDFAGWALAQEIFPQLAGADEILIANDSAYAPVRPLGEVFAAMAQRRCDFWGVSESLEFARHLQSFFIVFRKSAIGSDALNDFWRGVSVMRRKKDVIGLYELRLMQRLSESGLVGKALIDFASLGKPVCNPTFGAWRESIARGSPFLKVQLLRDNLFGDDISGWRDVVSAGGYDPNLIVNHLRRVAPEAAALRA